MLFRDRRKGHVLFLERASVVPACGGRAARALACGCGARMTVGSLHGYGAYTPVSQGGSYPLQASGIAEAFYTDLFARFLLGLDVQPVYGMYHDVARYHIAVGLSASLCVERTGYV